MTALLDVSVLIALAWPHHVHHAAARVWFDQGQRDGWATCTLTEAGFVRVSCNPSAIQHNVTPLHAISILEELIEEGNHYFWPMDWSIVDLPDSISPRIHGYRQVTDAVLLATAMQRGGQLATLDAGMEGLLAEKDKPFLYVIPV